VANSPSLRAVFDAGKSIAVRLLAPVDRCLVASNYKFPGTRFGPDGFVAAHSAKVPFGLVGPRPRLVLLGWTSQTSLPYKFFLEVITAGAPGTSSRKQGGHAPASCGPGTAARTAS
jgi:hypothetical protein